MNDSEMREREKNICIVTMAKKPNHIYSHKFYHNLKMCFFSPIEKQKPETDDCRNITTKIVVASKEARKMKKNEACQLENIIPHKPKKWR